jgi:hypothetical protein
MEPYTPVVPGSRHIRPVKSVVARMRAKAPAMPGPASADHDVDETATPSAVPASAFNISLSGDSNGKSVRVDNPPAEATATSAIDSSVLEAGPASADRDRTWPVPQDTPMEFSEIDLLRIDLMMRLQHRAPDSMPG